MFLNMLAIFFFLRDSRKQNSEFFLSSTRFVDDSIEILCVLSKNTFVEFILSHQLKIIPQYYII